MPLELLTDLEWPDTIFRSNTPARSAMYMYTGTIAVSVLVGGGGGDFLGNFNFQICK